jgi:hypothetical protein
MAQETIARVTPVEYPYRGRAHDHLLSNRGAVSTERKWVPERASSAGFRFLNIITASV